MNNQSVTIQGIVITIIGLASVFGCSNELTRTKAKELLGTPTSGQSRTTVPAGGNTIATTAPNMGSPRSITSVLGQACYPQLEKAGYIEPVAESDCTYYVGAYGVYATRLADKMILVCMTELTPKGQQLVQSPEAQIDAFTQRFSRIYRWDLSEWQYIDTYKLKVKNYSIPYTLPERVIEITGIQQKDETAKIQYIVRSEPNDFGREMLEHGCYLDIQPVEREARAKLWDDGWRLED